MGLVYMDKLKIAMQEKFCAQYDLCIELLTANIKIYR